MDESNCTQSGCLWEPVSGQPSCFLPESSVYGYEVNLFSYWFYNAIKNVEFISFVFHFDQINGTVNTFPNQKGFSVDLRRRRSADGSPLFSLYDDDVDQIVFEVNYHSDNSLGIAVKKR